eukprot:365976-Chlamydomonas_euryale.AAC.7
MGKHRGQWEREPEPGLLAASRQRREDLAQVATEGHFRRISPLQLKHAPHAVENQRRSLKTPHLIATATSGPAKDSCCMCHFCTLSLCIAGASSCLASCLTGHRLALAAWMVALFKLACCLATNARMFELTFVVLPCGRAALYRN